MVSKVKVKIQIDLKHSMALVSGKPIAIKVPKNATIVQIRLTPVRDDSFAKVLDVFFNGRPA